MRTGLDGLLSSHHLSDFRPGELKCPAGTITARSRLKSLTALTQAALRWQLLRVPAGAVSSKGRVGGAGNDGLAIRADLIIAGIVAIPRGATAEITVPGHRDRIPMLARVRFASDSPLEGDGFEPSVPRRRPSAPWRLDLLHPRIFRCRYSAVRVPRSSGVPVVRQGPMVRIQFSPAGSPEIGDCPAAP
jgi:hypothetical protein